MVGQASSLLTSHFSSLTHNSGQVVRPWGGPGLGQHHQWTEGALCAQAFPEPFKKRGFPGLWTDLTIGGCLPVCPERPGSIAVQQMASGFES